MKFAAIIVPVTIFLQGSVTTHAWNTIKGRILAEDGSGYGCLVSGISDTEDWCISASNGVSVGAKVGFKPCDMSDDSQMWKFEGNKWQSKVDPSRCMTVDKGNVAGITDGTPIRMADCSSAITFLFDVTDDYDHIVVKDNMKYCIVNRGVTPHSSDPMISKTCSTSEKRFLFSFRMPPMYEGYINDDAYPTPGCLVVKDEKAVAGQPLILGDCKLNHDWRLDSDGLFHTALIDSMCMQADPGSGKPIVSGVPLRLYACDSSNANQKFVLNGVDIRLEGYDTLCVGYRGDTSNVGVDPLILKACGKPGDNWSFD